MKRSKHPHPVGCGYLLKKYRSIRVKVFLRRKPILEDRLKGGRIELAADTTDMIGIALIVTEKVGTIEHHNPRILCICLKGGRGPVRSLIPKRDLFAHRWPSLRPGFCSID